MIFNVWCMWPAAEDIGKKRQGNLLEFPKELEHTLLRIFLTVHTLSPSIFLRTDYPSIPNHQNCLSHLLFLLVFMTISVKLQACDFVNQPETRIGSSNDRWEWFINPKKRMEYSNKGKSTIYRCFHYLAIGKSTIWQSNMGKIPAISANETCMTSSGIYQPCLMRVSIVMGVPQKRWMVYFIRKIRLK